MPEEEKQQQEQESGGGLKKILILLIGVLTLVFITAVVSIKVYQTMQEKANMLEEAKKRGEDVSVAKFDFSKEFLVPVATQGMIAKFSLQFEVNDPYLVQYFTDNEARFRDMVQRVIASYDGDRIKKDFASGKLQETIKKVINSYLKKHVPPDRGFLGLGKPKYRKVVKVNFFDFLVTFA